MTIQPTAVYPPGQSPASQQQFYQTYNTRSVGGGYAPPNPGQTGPGGGLLYRQFQRAPGGTLKVTVPSGVPRFLGGRPVILFAWLAAMMMVSLDEWHTHGVLPRPARLWYTSLTYFLLALVASFDSMVPLANGLAIGLTIAVAYNYYNGTGEFGASKEPQPTSGTGPVASGAGGGSGGVKAA